MADIHDLQRQRADLISRRADLLSSLAFKRRQQLSTDADEQRLLSVERQIADIEQRIARESR
jgi:hypothetical protein